MENKEKKLSAVELNDEKLENVSGGELDPMSFMCRCDKCGSWVDHTSLTVIDGKKYCKSCAGTL